MSNLKESVREYPGVMLVDAVSAYPALSKMTSTMIKALNQLRLYSEMDCASTLFSFQQMNKLLYRKPKTHACGRTMSWAKYAGSKQNKPKHNWGKKKRARMGWKV